MKDHKGFVRGFYWPARSWYAMSGRDPEIMFGMYAPEGGTSGEMAMRWHDLGDRLTPRLEVYCDAWSALQQFMDVLVELAEHDNEYIAQEEFVAILKACGVQDQTEYESPYPKDQHLRQRLAELEKEKREIEEQLRL